MGDWTYSNNKQSGAVTFSGYAGSRPVLLKLEGVRIAFEPGVFGGDGTERRKNICFSGVNEDILEQLRGLEAEIGGRVCSAIKGELLKCKFTPSATFVYDTQGAHTDAPPSWRNWTVNAIVKARGQWATHAQNGLCLDVTDIQLLKPSEEGSVCPFDVYQPPQRCAFAG